MRITKRVTVSESSRIYIMYRFVRKRIYINYCVYNGRLTILSFYNITEPKLVEGGGFNGVNKKNVFLYSFKKFKLN